jgi:urease accessory protein UreH
LSYPATPGATTKVDKRASPIDAWSARIPMRFGRRGGASPLPRRLRVQHALSEGVRCGDAILLHSPGIAGGDWFDMDVQMEIRAQALLTYKTDSAPTSAHRWQ